jgi:hypothetical protein
MKASINSRRKRRKESQRSPNSLKTKNPIKTHSVTLQGDIRGGQTTSILMFVEVSNI